MDEKQRTELIAKNLTRLRKARGMTQADLAELLHYSDKSVSKWERAEGVPDIHVLHTLAQYYGVRVDDLLQDELPAQPRQSYSTRQRILVTVLAVGLVWLTAVVIYFLCGVIFPQAHGVELAFLWAVPLSMIILVVFVHIWWGSLYRFLSVSALIWSLCTALFLTLHLQRMVLIFAVGAVLQLLAVFWYLLRLDLKYRRRQGK